MALLQEILDDLRAGKMIVLVDSEDRENEGDLICAAELVTHEHINFMARFGRGLICSPLTEDRALQLDLTLMPQRNIGKFQHCNFATSVDAKEGISTGISAYDRAMTVRTLARADASAEMLSTPGHVFPLIAKKGGVLSRAGHTEGTLDLLRLAGLKEVGLLCEIIGDDGTMLRGPALKKFAQKNSLKIYSISELIAHRRTHDNQLSMAVEARMPTRYGEFQLYVYTSPTDAKEHVALVLGKPKKSKPFLVRIHSECLTGDIFSSTRCDCHDQLHAALQQISKNGEGALIYMRQEGRGIGLINKLRAYGLQDAGYDTVQANEKLGFKADLRDYGVAAQILMDRGMNSIRLMTNNPQKVSELEAHGITIASRVPLKISRLTASQSAYLDVKKKKLGHLFP